VSDSGVGIEADRQNSIWDYGVTTTGTNNEKGYGIGLAVIKAICDAIGHEISYSSTNGKGSCFYLRIPIANSPSINSEPNVSRLQSESLDGRIVLVVDDQDETLHACSFLVQLLGATPLSASNMAEVHQIIRIEGNRPDLILTDFHLRDGKKGTDVIAEVRNVHERVLPAVIVTADESSAVEATKNLENVQVLNKPITKESLVQAASYLFASASS
jgi:CheY-like chemotaxis protein